MEVHVDVASGDPVAVVRIARAVVIVLNGHADAHDLAFLQVVYNQVGIVGTGRTGRQVVEGGEPTLLKEGGGSTGLALDVPSDAGVRLHGSPYSAAPQPQLSLLMERLLPVLRGGPGPSLRIQVDRFHALELPAAVVGIEHELEFVVGVVEGAVPEVVEPFLHDVHKVGLWVPADDDALGEIARIRVTLGARDDLD